MLTTYIGDIMNMTLSLDKNLSQVVQANKYIKWTEVARDAIKQKAIEIKKAEIFNKYVKKQELSEDEYNFLEEIDWHPVDEFPLKDSFVKELKRADNEKRIKLKSIRHLRN